MHFCDEKQKTKRNFAEEFPDENLQDKFSIQAYFALDSNPLIVSPTKKVPET